MAVAVDNRRRAKVDCLTVLSNQPPNRVPLLAPYQRGQRGSPRASKCRCPKDWRPGSPAAVTIEVGHRAEALSTAVLSIQPPNRVPFGRHHRRGKVLPDSLRMPMPQGLVTRISAWPSPS